MDNKITLDDLLQAKEARSAKQKVLLANHQHPLVSFTLNIPGEHKTFPLAKRTFSEGGSRLKNLLEQHHLPLLYEEEATDSSGSIGFYVVDAPAEALKALTLTLEEQHPLGRLFDLDVIQLDGSPLKAADLGRPPRGCYLCEHPVWVCSRNRTHSAEELIAFVIDEMEHYFTP